MVSPLEKAAINLVLVATAVLFSVSLWAPLLTLKKFYFVKNTFSILSGMTQLLHDGEIGLFLLLFLFTAVLPCVKLVILFLAWNRKSPGRHESRYLEWLSLLGKWSMLDVFVIAILIASVKLGAIATLIVHSGLYLFAASVVLMMASTQYIYSRLNRRSAARMNGDRLKIDDF